jgi:hypothetical protein
LPNEALRRLAFRSLLTGGIALAIAAVTPAGGARAQEGRLLVRVAGPYEISVSYLHTPPLVEVDNALVVEVRDTRTGEPVPGLERTLRLEASVAPPRASARPVFVTFRPAKDRPGVYEGVFVPPSVGDYAFRLVGDIGGVAVDETFRSGPGGLPVAEPASTDYASPGAYVAWGLLGAYLAGLAGLGVWRLRRRAPAGPAAVSGSGA